MCCCLILNCSVAERKERAERTSQMRSGAAKTHLQETKSEGGAQQVAEDQYSDEYIYDHAALWDTEGFESLPTSDCRIKWSNAVIAFFQWLAEEQKRRGREIMPPAPQRNIAIFASRSFISMKNWFNILTDRGYHAPLKKTMALIPEEEEEEDEIPVETVKAPKAKMTTSSATSPLPMASPRPKRPREELASPPSVQKSSEVRSRLASPPKTSTSHVAAILDAHSFGTTTLKRESPMRSTEIEAISSTPPRKQPRTEVHEAQQLSSPSYRNPTSVEKPRGSPIADLGLLKDLVDAEFARHHSALDAMKQLINAYQEQLTNSQALMYRLCGLHDASN